MYEEWGGAIDPVRQVCAGTEGIDSCSGDSGGPLVIDGHVIGLVSWANGCGIAGYPTVHARVAGHLDWIREFTDE